MGTKKSIPKPDVHAALVVIDGFKQRLEDTLDPDDDDCTGWSEARESAEEMLELLLGERWTTFLPPLEGMTDGLLLELNLLEGEESTAFFEREQAEA